MGAYGVRYPFSLAQYPFSLAPVPDPVSPVPDPGPSVRFRVPVSDPGFGCQMTDSGQISRAHGPGTGLNDRIHGFPTDRTKERRFSPGSGHTCQTKSSPGCG